MGEYFCVMIVVFLIIGFFLGRWRVLNNCRVVITTSGAHTFALDIPKKKEIPQYHELSLRVVKKDYQKRSFKCE